MVVADIIPAYLLAEKRTTKYWFMEGHSINPIEARKVTVDKWHAEWRMVDMGSWTKRLISDVRPWVTRKHGSVDYLT